MLVMNQLKQNNFVDEINSQQQIAVKKLIQMQTLQQQNIQQLK